MQRLTLNEDRELMDRADLVADRQARRGASPDPIRTLVTLYVCAIEAHNRHAAKPVQAGVHGGRRLRDLRELVATTTGRLRRMLDESEAKHPVAA